MREVETRTEKNEDVEEGTGMVGLIREFAR